MVTYKIIEKKNPLAVHALFSDSKRAERYLKETIPYYVAEGFFMDKSLTANDFEIEWPDRPDAIKQREFKTELARQRK